MTSEVLFLILGAVLTLIGGLFTFLITEYVRRRINRRDVKAAIRTDLEQLQRQMVTSSYSILSKLGELDRQFLTWFVPMHKKYAQDTLPPDEQSLLDQLMTLPDTSFQARNAQRKLEKTGVSIRKLRVPYIKAHMDQLPLLSKDCRKKILDIVVDVDKINEIIEEATFYFRKTFDSSSMEGSNVQIINNNLDSAYRFITQLSRNLTITVDKFLDSDQ